MPQIAYSRIEDIGCFNVLSVSSRTLILAIAGFSVTAGSFDIRARLKYSKYSGTMSLTMGTITIRVVEEIFNVRSIDTFGKSIPPIGLGIKIIDDFAGSMVWTPYYTVTSRETHP